MSKEKNKTAPKKAVKVESSEKKPKVNIKFKKIDFSKLKDMNWKPILKIGAFVLIFVGAFTLIDFTVQYFNNDFSVAIVNGTRLTKSEWHKLLERSYGAAVAQEMIENEIIKQEATKQKLSVTKEEMDTQIENIKTSLGGEEALNSALVANNLTLEELKDQIEVNLLTTKLLSPSVEYTDDDLKEFFNQYSDVIFPDETAALEDGAKLDFDQYKEKTTEVYIQQKVQTLETSWLATKKSESSIQDNSTDKPAYALFGTTINIINNLFGKK